MNGKLTRITRLLDYRNIRLRLGVLSVVGRHYEYACRGSRLCRGRLKVNVERFGSGICRRRRWSRGAGNRGVLWILKAPSFS
jgi:hypothetical protein